MPVHMLSDQRAGAGGRCVCEKYTTQQAENINSCFAFTKIQLNDNGNEWEKVNQQS